MDAIVWSVNYAHQNGIDRPEITDWKWVLRTALDGTSYRA